jgi:hypothetical protein
MLIFLKTKNMKKLLVVLSLALGCTQDENASVLTSTKDVIYIGGINYNVSVIEVDSCEYITLGSDVRTFTHKGNCKNPTHDTQTN